MRRRYIIGLIVASILVSVDVAGVYIAVRHVFT